MHRFYRIKGSGSNVFPQFAWLTNEQAMGYGDENEQIEVWTDTASIGGPMLDTTMARYLFEVIEEE